MIHFTQLVVYNTRITILSLSIAKWLRMFSLSIFKHNQLYRGRIVSIFYVNDINYEDQ